MLLYRIKIAAKDILFKKEKKPTKFWLTTAQYAVFRQLFAILKVKHISSDLLLCTLNNMHLALASSTSKSKYI